MSDYTVPYLYCPKCGKPLQKSMIFDRLRSSCPDCSFIHWGEFSLGVGGVLWHDNKVLLVKRGHNPGKGMWTIPGGYVDHDESIGDAVIREIKEETGINSQPLSIIALRDRPAEKHNAYIIFLMKFLGGNLRAQPSEVSDLGFYTLEECRTLSIASLTMSAVDASRSITTGLVRNTEVKLIDQASSFYQIK